MQALDRTGCVYTTCVGFHWATDWDHNPKTRGGIIHSFRGSMDGEFAFDVVSLSHDHTCRVGGELSSYSFGICVSRSGLHESRGKCPALLRLDSDSSEQRLCRHSKPDD